MKSRAVASTAAVDMWYLGGAMAKRKSIPPALAKLAAVEEQFLRTEFLAPVVAGRNVQVRIAGVRCSLAVRPADRPGWGSFRQRSHREAVMARSDTFAERPRY